VIAALRREIRFMASESMFRVWLLVALILSSVAVITGLRDVSDQRETIVRLVAADRADRDAQLAQQTEWGSAAYNAFHLTYDPPSQFAFAALGERDTLPWKHRIRALGLEGQIYETDASNPELSLVGRFDLALIAAFLLPLMIIVILHDLQARERQAGRETLLVSMAGPSLWTIRAGLRGIALAACVLTPMLIGGVISKASIWALLGASAIIMLHAFFWSAICMAAAALGRSAAVTLAGLMASWWLLAVLIPAGIRAVIDNSVPVAQGAQIALIQRETIHRAWDLPKSTTMNAFTDAYPEWVNHAQVSRPFEWKWYFAFQEVGDLQVAELSRRYRSDIAAREGLADRLAWLSPPALVERLLQRLAKTDMSAHLLYIDNVRAFHAALRHFYYPKLFREEPFDTTQLAALPTFDAQKTAIRPSRRAAVDSHLVACTVTARFGEQSLASNNMDDVPRAFEPSRHPFPRIGLGNSSSCFDRFFAASDAFQKGHAML
jgi:ABC-2 type transport system permease protein